MKIAILGSAPSSVRLAPYADPRWQIWGCSPGLYPLAGRIDEWFELHRYEPPTLGRLDQQVPWFSPEYCGWMVQQKLVWMHTPMPEIPGSKALPWKDLVEKYGPYFFNSTISWMLAMAIERILLNRKHAVEPVDTQHAIGLWGVDMAAGEEYGYQRAGCQYFVLLAKSLNIEIVLPPESDLMRPSALYGIDEHLHRRIKWSAKRKELELHKKVTDDNIHNAVKQSTYLQGALDTLTYMENNWGSSETGEIVPEVVFGNTDQFLQKLKANLADVVAANPKTMDEVLHLIESEERPTGT